MLKPHELDRAEQIVYELLRDCGIPFDPVPGAYGRTLTAVELFRSVADRPSRYDRPAHAKNLLAELICVYAVGIVRGDGQGIALMPSESPL